MSRNTFVRIIFRSEHAISIIIFFCYLFNDAISKFVTQRRWQTNKQNHVASMELYQHRKTEALQQMPTIMHVVHHKSHTECTGTLPRPRPWKPAADRTDINLQVLNYIFSKMSLVQGNRISHFNRKTVCVLFTDFLLQYRCGCGSVIPHLHNATGDQHHFTYFPAMHSLMKITAHCCVTSKCGLPARIINAGHFS